MKYIPTFEQFINEQYNEVLNEELRDLVQDVQAALGRNNSPESVSGYLGRSLSSSEADALIRAGVMTGRAKGRKSYSGSSGRPDKKTQFKNTVSVAYEVYELIKNRRDVEILDVGKTLYKRSDSPGLTSIEIKIQPKKLEKDNKAYVYSLTTVPRTYYASLWVHVHQLYDNGELIRPGRNEIKFKNPEEWKNRIMTDLGITIRR